MIFNELTGIKLLNRMDEHTHWVNSWGGAWWEQGYFKIKRGENMCGIAVCNSFPKDVVTVNPNYSSEVTPVEFTQWVCSSILLSNLIPVNSLKIIEMLSYYILKY